MQLTLAGSTALAILRHLRRQRRALPVRCDLRAPDPSPQARWSAKLIDLSRFGFDAGSQPIETLVGAREQRLRVKGVKCRTCLGELPRGAFLDLGDGLCASGPELLFLEKAARSSLSETALLGLELCGCYSLDQYGGEAALELAPATSVERIGTFLAQARGMNGLIRARQALRCIADNAWSPMEAIVSCMMMLPLEEYGYGFGHCTLNVRIDTHEVAIGPGDKGERVPDILVDGTPVGINYDGALHLDLDSIVKAAVEAGSHPESSRGQLATERVVARVRAKAVDDIRRNRALSAAGLTVYPVVKEDLYERGALDGVMWQVLLAIEGRTKRRYPLLHEALQGKAAQDERFELLATMLPGRVVLPEDDGVREVFVRLPNRKRFGF